MTRRLLALTLTLTALCVLHAQRSDTLTCGYDHAFGWRQTIAPAALIGTGGIITALPYLHKEIDGSIREWSQRDGHAFCKIENVVQYLPLASTFVLKAAGLKSQHGWRDMTCLVGGSCLTGLVVGTGMKYAIGVERPYGGTFNSFPSGHTLTAFMGAELIRREYGEEYPGIAVAGYAVATGVGLMRIYNDYHWASDVLAGAGVGILSASLMYWLAPYLRF